MPDENRDVFWLCYGDYRGKRTVKSFVRYVIARLKKDSLDTAYRFYISDSLYYQTQQKRLNVRYRDMIDTKKQQRDTRTAEQIVADVLRKAELQV